ncbi:MAG: DJ-1/PfpI family protein [Actinomycetota bacterium]
MPAAATERRWRRRSRSRSDAPRFGLPALAAVRRPESAVVIGVLVYRGVTTAEIDAPVTRLAHRLDADVRFVGPAAGSLHGVEPSRTVIIDSEPGRVGAVDVLVVPGGLGWRSVVDTPSLREWLTDAAGDARAVLAVSTGSLLLAAVGRLAGREATGHWLAERDLERLGAVVTSDRTASDEAGRLVTASGARAAMTVVDSIADRVRWSA